MTSDSDLQQRLIARLRSLDPEMPDAQITRLAGLFVQRKYKDDMWSYYNNRTITAGLSDEVFQARLDAIKKEVTADNIPELPGLGLRLGHLPQDSFPFLKDQYDNLGWRAATLLNREVCILNVIEKLTNKPEWWRKCRDDEIAAHWKKEMLGMDWPKLLDLPHADFTTGMAEAVIDEVRKKAVFYEDTGLIPVMDYSAAVIKSDRILTGDLMKALKSAVAPLENVPEEQKDWHPGSNNQVLDLVHPSLWPLIYGKTRWVPGTRIGLEEAPHYLGAGSIIPQPLEVERAMLSQSTKFQWLPCDVSISSEGKATIESYINNLHPGRHEGLYDLIGSLIEKSLPAWDMIYSWPTKFQKQRLFTKHATLECAVETACAERGWCCSMNRPLEAGESARKALSEDGYDEDLTSDEDAYELEYDESSPHWAKDREWFERTHKPVIPEPNPNLPLGFDASDVASSGFFDGAARVQVIVKLANIHLTPDSPTYDGGAWHIEGMLNEHICATALYYYDNDNISDSYLSFRTSANEEDLGMELGYDEMDHLETIERVFAISVRQTVQNIGKVLTRSGRSLFFPNIYQHRVSPFKLDDPTRPGHRKILALFLVDPKIPIISTSIISPQQRHWWDSDAAFTSKLLLRFPVELQEMVMQEADRLMDLDEAKRVRLELMKERTAVHDSLNGVIEGDDFNFCEH